MATTKYFQGNTELTRIQPMSNKEFALRFPGIKGRRWDGFSRIVGMPVGYQPAWTGRGYSADLRPVERAISYKSNPSKHECDARCMNATGRTMQCECSCGGKNHGRGSFHCAAE